MSNGFFKANEIKEDGGRAFQIEKIKKIEELSGEDGKKLLEEKKNIVENYLNGKIGEETLFESLVGVELNHNEEEVERKVKIAFSVLLASVYVKNNERTLTDEFEKVLKRKDFRTLLYASNDVDGGFKNNELSIFFFLGGRENAIQFLKKINIILEKRYTEKKVGEIVGVNTRKVEEKFDRVDEAVGKIFNKFQEKSPYISGLFYDLLYGKRKFNNENNLCSGTAVCSLAISATFNKTEEGETQIENKIEEIEKTVLKMIYELHANHSKGLTEKKSIEELREGVEWIALFLNKL